MILLLVLGTSILSYTTSPIVLTVGLERLMSPLAKIKIPVQEFFEIFVRIDVSAFDNFFVADT